MREKRSGQILFADVFAGCGGLSLGLMQAGLTGRFAIEQDRFAFDTLQTNLLKKGGNFRFSWPRWLPQTPISIGTLLAEYGSKLESMRGEIGLLVGGPPCQGFSSAGRRRHDDPRNELFNSYLSLVDVLQPRAVLIENVRGFTMDFRVENDGKNYAEILREKLAANFEVFERLLDLSLFGVPQQRKRYFLLAVRPGITRSDPFDELMKRLPSFLRSQGLKAPVSSWSAISDLEISRGGVQASSEYKDFNEIRYVRPLTNYQRLLNCDRDMMSNLRLARHGDEITARFKKIIAMSHEEGRLNTSISRDVRERFGLKKMALRVLDPDQPSPTITSLPDDLLHYREPRTLTVRENARLQSFPDWYDFRGKYTTGGHLRRKEVPRFTQVANAVPPLVARAFGEFLADILGASNRRPTNRLVAPEGIQECVEVVTQT